MSEKSLVPDGDPSRQIELVVTDDGVMLAGSNDSVRAALDQFSEFGKTAIEVADVNQRKAASALAAGAGGANTIASAMATSGRMVMLSKASAEKLKTMQLIPAGNGYSHGVLATSGGKFGHLIKFKQVPMASPGALVGVQMLAVQMALQAAIADVTKAVERVEGKVDDLLKLANADRVGDVLGHNMVLRRLSNSLDMGEPLTDADWNSVASLGPSLQVAVERLREHCRQTLAAFDPEAPIGKRAGELEKAVTNKSLGESLRLLIVAEHSLYLWERVRVERIRIAEPDHIDTAMASARRVLAENFEADNQVLAKARSVLSDYSKVKPLEFTRWASSSKVREHVQMLRADVDGFAEARASQVYEWTEHKHPTLGDAWHEVERVSGSTWKAMERASGAAANRVLDSGAQSMGKLGRRLQDIAEGRTSRGDAPESEMVDLDALQQARSTPDQDVR